MSYLIGIMGSFTDGETFGPFTKRAIAHDDIPQEVEAGIIAMQAVAAQANTEIHGLNIVVSFNEPQDAPGRDANAAS